MVLDGFDNQTNTGKRFSNSKRAYSKYVRDWILKNPTLDPNQVPFVLRQISKDQDTRFIYISLIGWSVPWSLLVLYWS